MKTYSVAIVGATGAVGTQMLQCLEEQEFPVGSLKLLASPRSAGKVVATPWGEVTVEAAAPEAFDGVDIVLGAAEDDIALALYPEAVKRGAVVVDNSHAFRLDADVPLVVPEINPEDAFEHKGVIANPNCSTIITLVALSGIRRVTEIERMVACTYQAVSGAGVEGMRELEEQIQAHAKGESAENRTFPCQILSNVIPQIGSELENGYTTEEMKMQNEGRKILHLPEMKVTCTCVRVPVLRSHSISLSVRTKEKISVAAAREAIAKARGCKLVDDLESKQYPMPLDTSDQDLVYVGRIRDDLTDERALALWCAGDQIRKGAATNAVQIAELLL